MENIIISAPFADGIIENLKAGDYVLLNGCILTGRDAAHKRLFEALNSGDKMPIDIKDEAIYYVGACFGQDGIPTAAGPTTSMRMDAYAPALYDAGLKATIGKGDRNKQVYDAIKRNKAVYFAAIGGAGAIYAKAIKKSQVLSYPELGTEAIYRFEVEEFPLIVAIDSKGNSIYPDKD